MTATVCDSSESSGVSLRASFRRGACPSIAAPMRTGDGLLVRLRPAQVGLSPSDYVAIARLAAAHGNGLIEVTARGNLQIRGLREETVPKLAAGLAEAGIDLHRGVAVETPPLSGVDPDEIADAEPLAAAIRSAIAGHLPPLVLAPKLSIVVDGGGHLNLSGMTADVRLDACARGGKLSWGISVGGNAQTARVVGVVADEDAVSAVMGVIEALNALGATARGRDLDPGALRARLGMAEPMQQATATKDAPSPIGLHTVGSVTVLGIGLPHGQAPAARLESLMQGLAALRATEIRLAPHRALLLLGLTADVAEQAAALARQEGFWTRAGEPGNAIAVCAGAKGCASGRFDTKAVADLLVARAPGLLDGSMTVHVSGCPKGCAHPQPAALTLAGDGRGVGLVIDGCAGDAPHATVPVSALEGALLRVAAMLGSENQKGQTARGALGLIGASAVAKAYQQGSQ